MPKSQVKRVLADSESSHASTQAALSADTNKLAVTFSETESTGINSLQTQRAGARRWWFFRGQRSRCVQTHPVVGMRAVVGEFPHRHVLRVARGVHARGGPRWHVVQNKPKACFLRKRTDI